MVFIPVIFSDVGVQWQFGVRVYVLNYWSVGVWSYLGVAQSVLCVHTTNQCLWRIKMIEAQTTVQFWLKF
jgi:hypothetical protein